MKCRSARPGPQPPDWPGFAGPEAAATPPPRVADVLLGSVANAGMDRPYSQGGAPFTPSARHCLLANDPSSERSGGWRPRTERLRIAQALGAIPSLASRSATSWVKTGGTPPDGCALWPASP